MDNLYNAMDYLLLAEENMNSLKKLLEMFNQCAKDEQAKSAQAMLSVFGTVIASAVERQREAIGLIDIYIAENASSQK